MVMWSAWSETRNATASATSDGRASLRSGMPTRYASSDPSIVARGPSSSSHIDRSMVVSVDPGETTLQRTP
jgi:hypothetical protein